MWDAGVLLWLDYVLAREFTAHCCTCCLFLTLSVFGGKWGDGRYVPHAM